MSGCGSCPPLPARRPPGSRSAVRCLFLSRPTRPGHSVDVAVNTALQVPGHRLSPDLSASLVSTPWTKPRAGTGRRLAHTGKEGTGCAAAKALSLASSSRLPVTPGLRPRIPTAGMRKLRLGSWKGWPGPPSLSGQGPCWSEPRFGEVRPARHHSDLTWQGRVQHISHSTAAGRLFTSSEGGFSHRSCPPAFFSLSPESMPRGWGQ